MKFASNLLHILALMKFASNLLHIILALTKFASDLLHIFELMFSKFFCSKQKQDEQEFEATHS
jgi:hypothetical protein